MYFRIEMCREVTNSYSSQERVSPLPSPFISLQLITLSTGVKLYNMGTSVSYF